MRQPTISGAEVISASRVILDVIVAVCGSTRFHEQMKQVQKRLEESGHSVLLPHLEFGDFHRNRDTNREEWKRLKPKFMREHFDKIKRSDGVLILNYDKDGIMGYIGGNTLMELAIAYEHEKPIFLLNPIPKGLPYSDEIDVMSPVVLNGDLDRLFAAVG
jgi:hypothetical protein